MSSIQFLLVRSKVVLRKFLLKIYHLFGIKTSLVHLGEVSMYLDLVTPGISSTLFVYRTREDDKLELIRRLLPSTGDVIDCGSNIGFYPIFISRLIHPSQRLISLEPDLRNFSLLSMNKQFLAIPPHNYIMLNVAAHSRSCDGYLDVSRASNLSRLSLDTPKYTSQYQSVRCLTIDTIVENYALTPMFIRMDAEGHEVEILHGMRVTTSNAPTGFTLLIEVHPDAYSPSRSFSDELHFLFNNNFVTQYIVSAGEPIPPLFKSLGLSPTDIFTSDGFKRGLYTCISRADTVRLVTATPKCSRYIALSKK